MVTRTKPDPSCQLYAIARAGEGDAPVRALAAALKAAPIYAVLIAPHDGRWLDPAQVAPLIELTRSNAAVALVLDDVALAGTLKADGVHLSLAAASAEALIQARQTLAGDFIIGADAGSSRDDAMTLGERGADYIAFSLPPAATDVAPAREQRYEHVAWWAELFELPSVVLDVENSGDAGALAKAGADFVAFDIAAGLAPFEIGEQVGAFAAAIRPRRLVGQG